MSQHEQTAHDELMQSADDFAREREDQIPAFVETNPAYYKKQFRKNAKDAHRNMIEIGLANASSASVSNSVIEKT